MIGSLHQMTYVVIEMENWCKADRLLWRVELLVMFAHNRNMCLGNGHWACESNNNHLLFCISSIAMELHKIKRIKSTIQKICCSFPHMQRCCSGMKPFTFHFHATSCCVWIVNCNKFTTRHRLWLTDWPDLTDCAWATRRRVCVWREENVLSMVNAGCIGTYRISYFRSKDKSFYIFFKWIN